MARDQTQSVLERLADPALGRAEAEALLASLSAAEPEMVLTAFRWLHDARDEPSLYAAVRLLAGWAEAPVAKALPPALWAMLDEPAVGDLNKLAAADLLERLGEPVDRAELLLRLRDPTALARDAVRSALAAVEAPLALVSFLDALAREPRDLVLALVEDLLALGDPRAEAVLAPLAQAADPDLSVTAAAGLELLGGEVAAGTLALVAAHHPDATTRREAERALGRLPEGRRPSPPSQAATVHLSTLDASGGQYVVLSRATRGRHGVLALYHTDSAGVLQYAASELASAEELASLLARLGTGGRRVVAVPPPAAAWVLEAAAARTLDAGGAAALGYAAWPWVLGAEGRETALLAGPVVELAATAGLAAHPAFAGWRPGEAELAGGGAARWAWRLRHQAWLLERAGEGEAATLAATAAAGLDGPGAPPPAAQPWFQALAGAGAGNRTSAAPELDPPGGSG